MPKAEALRREEHAEDRQFVTALARGLDILRCFDRPGVELSVSDIARRVGLSQPTAWRLCHTLAGCGYLIRSSGSLLRVGAPVLALGYAALQGMSLPALALPYMREITARTRATTTLSLHEDVEMISVECCLGEFVLPNQTVGWRRPLTAVPSGLAALAAMPASERQELLARIRDMDPKAWARRAKRVERACADYVRDGFVIRDDMVDGQYAAVAVPILGEQDGTRVWALSCGGLASRWNRKGLREVGAGLRRVRELLEPALPTLAA